jgi:hypothetical protein
VILGIPISPTYMNGLGDISPEVDPVIILNSLGRVRVMSILVV